MATTTEAAPQTSGSEVVPFLRGMYLHVIFASVVGGFAVLGWFVLYQWLLELIWENDFVTTHAWMFPVICLPFSLLVGLLVKYAHAPSNLDASILDAFTGKAESPNWRKLPTLVAQSLSSLFSGAVLGPEAAIGQIATMISGAYSDLFRIPAERRGKLILASVASGYNGLLENPLFTSVLGSEAVASKAQGLASMPATLIGGAIGYGIFLLLGGAGFADFLHLPPISDYSLWWALLMVPLGLIGLLLAVLAGVFLKGAERFFSRFKDRIVTRALVAGVVFSIVGYFAPVVMFSGETQEATLISGAAGYGIAVLLVIAVAKVALMAVGFRSGFLGGPIFPLVFASTAIALALNLAFPGVPLAIFVAGIATGAAFAFFRTPLMVLLLIGFMLGADATLIALIVVALAAVMIVMPPLQHRMAERQAHKGDATPPSRPASAGDRGRGEPQGV